MLHVSVRQSFRLCISLNMRPVAIYRKLPPARLRLRWQVLRGCVWKEATTISAVCLSLSLSVCLCVWLCSVQVFLSVQSDHHHAVAVIRVSSH